MAKGGGSKKQSSLYFLKDHVFLKPAPANDSGSKSLHSENIKEEQSEAPIDDIEIEKAMKRFLETSSHGKFLTPEIVAHFDYFMNTLRLDHPSRGHNPCDEENIASFPALQYTPDVATDGS